MLDDDAIIELENDDVAKEYIEEIDKHKDGFCFIKGGSNKYNPYADSQLNLCAISRYIYEKEPIPNIDALKNLKVLKIEYGQHYYILNMQIKNLMLQKVLDVFTLKTLMNLSLLLGLEKNHIVGKV